MEAKVRIEHPPVVLHTRPALEMDDEQLFEFCRINRGWRIERTAEGDLEIMVPTGGETSNRNSIINHQLAGWTLQDGTGVSFDSSGGFVLPNGAMRSPDALWVNSQRLADLTAEQKRKFLPLCPDFVVELRSPSDPLATVQAKMSEYVENGARLGWLIDPEERKIHVYESDKVARVLEHPSEISGDPVLSGFVLDLRRVWTPGF